MIFFSKGVIFKCEKYLFPSENKKKFPSDIVTLFDEFSLGSI